MDEREKRGPEVSNQRSRQQGMNRRPGNSANRPGNPRTGGQRVNPNRQRVNPNARRRKSSRARRRQRNSMFMLILLVLILIGVVGSVAIWKRYGPSKEKANLEQYYGLTNDDDLAVIVNNQVIKDEENQIPAGKIIDGEAYVEYSVVRKKINGRFYWDPNESVMLYTCLLYTSPSPRD